MSVTGSFAATPWARGALLRDPGRAALAAIRAQELGASVSIIGARNKGPWVVRVGDRKRTLRFAGYDLHLTLEFGLDRFAAGADDTAIVWMADSDGLGHGHRFRATRTLCGLPRVDERYKHPESARCHACWRALDRKVLAA